MFDFTTDLLRYADKAERSCSAVFADIDRVCAANSRRVLSAFIDNKVSATHFKGTSGYGYDDAGREVCDKVYAQVLGCDDAFVRYTFANGTHALATMLFALLTRGDDLVVLSGKPYDTLARVTDKLRGDGVSYAELDCALSGVYDEDACGRISRCTAAYIQRSRGYGTRKSLSADEVNACVARVRELNPKAIVLVDNCYGEFVDTVEPDGDIIAGSLIKNIGGGIAQTGGYVAGRKCLVDKIADRLIVPGMGREVGCFADGVCRDILKGLYFAPSVTASAMKTAVFARALFVLHGYNVYPNHLTKPADIVTAITLGSPGKLKSFCAAIQGAGAVDSHVAPTPAPMPGYDCDVIMASPSFTEGSSIEISCDAPFREPYVVYLQGGLTYETGKLAVLNAAAAVGANTGAD
ncbi:hypothetical protein FACS1894133_1470 [Clostridia bacterium]|nr:hypothetical protein FACS1894133_1470 [Clostridia bacterium]